MKPEAPNQGGFRLPGAIYRDVATGAGQQMWGLLLTEETWIHRRVETVDMLSTQFLRRSISVDFTLPERARADLAVGGTGQTLVPLSTLAKRPLRNFDLRDEGGMAVPVLGRGHNGPLAHSTLTGVARHALEEAGLGSASDRLKTDLQQIAAGSPDEADHAISCMVEAAKGGNQECRVVLDDDAALFLLADLADNYLLVAICGDVTSRRVLKFSYEEPLDSVEPGIIERLGWRPLLVGLEVPSASRAASYHAEVVVPEELRFDACFLYDEETDEVYAEDQDADRAALHAVQVPLGARTFLLFGLQAERASFPVVGCLVAWITGLLLLGGAVVGDLDPGRADSAVAVLLAASAVFVGVIARSGEHRMVQALFAGPRLLLAVTAVSALVAGASLAYNMPSSTVCSIWLVAAVVSLTVAVSLTITAVVARPIALGER